MKIYCETHKRDLVMCSCDDQGCTVCGCGGLCDSKEPCTMSRRVDNADRLACGLH